QALVIRSGALVAALMLGLLGCRGQDRAAAAAATHGDVPDGCWPRQGWQHLRHLPGGCVIVGDFVVRHGARDQGQGTGADGRMSAMTSQALVIRSGALVAALMLGLLGCRGQDRAAAAAAT
ncbi:hypothetical protein C7E25_21710, partial [Stenotrophomonas maltophilia]